MTVPAPDSANPRAKCKRDKMMVSKTAGWAFQDETGWLLDATIIVVEAIRQATASRIVATAS